jgi:hypothetical protein
MLIAGVAVIPASANTSAHNASHKTHKVKRHKAQKH